MKPENPEQYFAFLQAHNAIDQQIQAASASSQAKAAQLTASTAATYHISADDFPKLTVAARSAVAGLQQWEAAVRAYSNQQRASGRLPDMKTLKAFQFQRYSLTTAAYHNLHKSISATSWDGLYAYINTDFRLTVKP